MRRKQLTLLLVATEFWLHWLRRCCPCGQGAVRSLIGPNNCLRQRLAMQQQPKSNFLLTLSVVQLKLDM